MTKQAAQIPRSTSAAASAVLEAAAKRRRRSIRLHEDGKWLRQLTRNPARLLGEMANRQLLYRVGAGRYVIAPRGTVSLEQAAPAELLVDILLGGRTSYYVGFLSALISHRLTDLHSNDIYAAVLASGPVKRPPRLPGRELHLAYLNEKRWPGTEAGEIERVRAFGEAKEFWWRSSAERTLVDSLTRPEMSGGIETTISCWSRAHLDDRVDWSEVARIAKRLGPSAERRTAFVMTRLEIEGARRWFAGLDGRSSNVLLDRSQGFALHGRASRDSSTGVVVNVPDDRLSGWMAGAGLG